MPGAPGETRRDRDRRQGRRLGAATGRRDDGRVEQWRAGRLGQRRLRRDGCLRRSPGSAQEQPPETPPLRHHRRNGLGCRARLRRHDRGLRRAARLAGEMSRATASDLYDRVRDAAERYEPAALVTIVRGDQVGAKAGDCRTRSRSARSATRELDQQRSTMRARCSTPRSRRRAVRKVGQEIGRSLHRRFRRRQH